MGRKCMEGAIPDVLGFLRCADDWRSLVQYLWRLVALAYGVLLLLHWIVTSRDGWVASMRFRRGWARVFGWPPTLLLPHALSLHLQLAGQPDRLAALPPRWSIQRPAQAVSGLACYHAACTCLAFTHPPSFWPHFDMSSFPTCSRHHLRGPLGLNLRATLLQALCIATVVGVKLAFEYFLVAKPLVPAVRIWLIRLAHRLRVPTGECV